jgi:hypothetical protein
MHNSFLPYIRLKLLPNPTTTNEIMLLHGCSITIKFSNGILDSLKFSLHYVYSSV